MPRRLLTFVTLLLLSLFTSQGPAHAVNYGYLDYWPGTNFAPCATGAITEVSHVSGFEITGWITPCDTPPAGSTFGFIYYDGVAHGDARHTYLADGSRNDFRAVISEFEPGTNAICLARSQHRRIACLAFDQTTYALTPISIDDPRVAVGYAPKGIGDPNCGSCLNPIVRWE